MVTERSAALLAGQLRLGTTQRGAAPRGLSGECGAQHLCLRGRPVRMRGLPGGARRSADERANVSFAIAPPPGLRKHHGKFPKEVACVP